jgi:hypothetical protein
MIDFGSQSRVFPLVVFDSLENPEQGNIENGASYLIVNEGGTRESRAFREISDFNFHPARLPPERLSSKYGCLSQRLLRLESPTFRK